MSGTGEKAGEGAVLGVLRAAEAIRRRMADAVDAEGLTVPQYNVLRVLRTAYPESLPTLAIGRMLLEKTPGTTRLLERLVARKLVRRERPAANRRVVQCWITPAGVELLSRLDGPMEGLEAVVSAQLGEAGEAAVGRVADVLQQN